MSYPYFTNDRGHSTPRRDLRGAGIWQGSIHKKPWQYLITAVIPILDHSNETEVCVELLRLQTCKPYIILVDTGSTEDHVTKTLPLRGPDLEIHTIRRQAAVGPSDVIANALDLGFSIAETPYVFTTHQDCFLKTRTLLEFMAYQLPGKAAVGYQLTERPHRDWQSHLGHTCTLFDLATWDRIGATWSLRRAPALQGLGRHHPGVAIDAFMDTEATMNYCFSHAKVETAIIGTETNYERNQDEFIDHCRSLVCSSLYSAEHHTAALGWSRQAMLEAWERIRTWKASGPADPD